MDLDCGNLRHAPVFGQPRGPSPLSGLAPEAAQVAEPTERTQSYDLERGTLKQAINLVLAELL